MRQLILLDQAAAIVGRRKRCLQAYIDPFQKNALPDPAREGGGHSPNLYDWAVLKPWLEKTFGVELPVEFPGKFISG